VTFRRTLRATRKVPTGDGSTLASMSEKRQRHQQRRQRRKAQGAARSRGGADSLERMLAEIAELAIQSVPEVLDGLEAEQWASGLMGTWLHQPDADAVLFPGLVRALAARRTAPALAALRALSAVGAPGRAERARAAADRLAAADLPEPAWARELGAARATAAALLCEDDFDDGVSVIVEFSGSHTLGIYVDHNLGGLVKDVFLAGPLAEVRAEFARHGEPGIELRALDFAEARARVEAALYMLDHTLDPPVSEDVHVLRALVEARLRLLPAGFALPDDYAEFTPDEREALLADFLDAPEGARWRGDGEAEDIAATAIDFGADYNHGGPLRWSPVVVELFLTDWLPRKISADTAYFERVPEVLADWVRYAGRQRGVQAGRLSEAVAAVAEYRDEMLGAVDDPEAWGPAKTFAAAALAAGVDLSDGEQVEQFVQRYNEGLVA
jgi:hypothetical protein